jgi:hypothetical protein
MPQHDYTSVIVGHRDPVPSGKGWLPQGPYKTIWQWTCQNCGHSFTGTSSDSQALYQLISTEPCPGVPDARQ